jgi:ferric enterobactin receptor
VYSLALRNLKICLLFFAGYTNQSFGQEPLYKQYSFNNEGSVCYFHYVCFSPSNSYFPAKRPYVFVMGNPGQTALQAYEADSLKDVPRFYNYMFVYVPNTGTKSSEKLDCLTALASYATWNYVCGKKNVFLSIYDPSITPADTVSYDLKDSFHSIRLNQGSSNSTSIKSKIEDDFKEDVNAYDEQGSEDDNLGTFYYEEENKSAEEQTGSPNPYANKTYYGPPQDKDFTLSGLVKDKSTGEALPFATIHLRGSTKAISTNADGYFTLSKVPTDTSVLIVSYVGYAKTEVYLTPFVSKKNLIVEVSSAGNQLKTVTIVTAKEEVVLSKQEEVSVIKITPKELEKLPNIGEKDVMRSFQLMPGVSASQESSSGLYVRGGTPDQNLVLYDGFTVYHVDHLYGFFSAFNANAVKDVQLYKGGFESRFGGRLSSVTEITGKDGNQKKINIGGDLSLLSANIFAEIPIGDKFSSVIAFRRSYKGPIYNKLIGKYSKSSTASATTQQGGGGSGGGGRFSQNTVAKSYFYDLNGKFTYRPTQKDIIALSIFNGTDKFDNSIDNSNVPSFGGGGASNFSFSSTDLTKYGNIGTSLKWSRKWAPRFYGNTLISYSNFYSDRDRSQQRTVTDASGNESTTKNGIFENNNLKDYSFKSDYQWDLFEMSQLQFGVFATRYDIKYTYAQNDTSTILNKDNQAVLAGGYIQNKFKLLKNKLIFVPGIRASYYGMTKQNYYEPRASLSLKITKQLTLKGATGKYYQFANRVTREDILSGNKDFWLLSNGKEIPVSSSLHYISGLSFETTHLLFSAEGYYKKIQNLTEYSLRFNTSPTGTAVDENFYTGYGYARGVEFLVQKKTGKFNGWVSYTLGEARNHFDTYSDTYFPANQDVTHEFKIVLLYRWKRWDFSATWIYATGRPYTAPSGAYNVALLDGTTQDFFTVTNKNGLRLPDYHRADISANYKLLTGSKGDKKRREVGYLSFSIFNLYNRTNVWYKTYSIESGSVIETNVNYTSITPNITLSLKLR